MQFRRIHDGGFEGKIMDQIIVAGIHKKSFELFYNGGTLWAEHLDGMGTYSPLVIEKF